ncbi:MAG: DUF3530 family protein [Betaproteobacteria bacterium]
MLLAGWTVAASAADYAREERWAQEIMPALVVGDAIWMSTPARPKVLALLTEPAGAAKGAAIVIHGLGVHPDWGLNGGLRSGLADAGFTTLSVQMPVLDADATRDDYAATFAEAGDRIAAAIAYLRAKGSAKIGIVAHSVGASMVNAYLARPDAAPVDAWVPLGMLVDFASPPKEPVLDVRAENELPQVTVAAPLRAPKLPRDRCSRQITIAGTDHYFESRLADLTAAIAAFLGRVYARDC